MNKKVLVAIDHTEWSEIENLTHALKGSDCGFKVGMELYYSHGPKAVEFLADQGFRVFLDLKLHDIPTTVKKSLLNLFKLPAFMFNVHASGGRKMLEAAAEAQLKSGRKDIFLIAVTQLTSMTEEAMNKELKISSTLEECVSDYAYMAYQAGLAGVVCSAHEVELIKQKCKPSFLCVTPGIRPRGSQTHDQKRVMMPSEAIAAGADYLVIGRAITDSNDPRQALENLFLE